MNLYRRGIRKEYKICKELRDEGFDIVQRSAGSHSPVDIWAVNYKTKEILLVQSKASGESNKYKEEEKNLNGKFNVRFQIR